MIRVMLVEDHAALRHPLAIMLAREPGVAVVAEAGSLAEARRLLPPDGVDVAVLDLGLPDGEGPDLIPDLRAANPEGSALILSAETDEGRLAQAVTAGAQGVLHKSATFSEIVAAVHTLGAGRSVLTPAQFAALVRMAGDLQSRGNRSRDAFAHLTRRERDVLQSLAEGLDNEAIAARLFVGLETVRTHTANLLRKLDVDSRLQAVLLAIRHGIVKLP